MGRRPAICGALLLCGMTTWLVPQSHRHDTNHTGPLIAYPAWSEPQPDYQIILEGPGCTGLSNSIEIQVEVRRMGEEPIEQDEHRAELVLIHSSGAQLQSAEGFPPSDSSPGYSTQEALLSGPSDFPEALTSVKGLSQEALFRGRTADLLGLETRPRIRLYRAAAFPPAGPVVVLLRIEGGGMYWRKIPSCEELKSVPGPEVQEHEGVPPVLPAGGPAPAELPRPGVFSRSRDIGPPLSPLSPGGAISASVTLTFTDDHSAVSPIRFATVELWDHDDGSPDDLLASGVTDAGGFVTFTGIDNGDGDDAGGQDLFFRFYLTNDAVWVDNGGTIYQWTSSTYNDRADGSSLSVTLGVTTGALPGACNIFDTITKAWQFAGIHATPAPSQVRVLWPDNDANSSSSYSDRTIRIEGDGQEEPDQWDESVQIHEYGHFLDGEYSGGFWPDGGGSDGYGGNGHSWSSAETPAIAWGEGWSDFLQSAVRSYWGYPNAAFYEETTWSTSLETGANWPGQSRTDVEGAIAAALWDVFDSVDDAGDTLSDGFSHIWSVFEDGTGNETIAFFWDDWTASLFGNLPALSEIFYAHGCYAAVDDSENPSVMITTPTAGPTYSTAEATLSLGGSSSDSLNVVSVGWVNDRGGSGTAGGTSSWSVPTINLASGQNTLTVTAYDRKGNTATDTLTVTCSAACVPPSILSNPASQIVVNGQSALLSVTAGGTSPSYQWYRGASGDNSQPIAGATSSTYSTGPLGATASYWVQISNDCGSVNSNTASATVVFCTLPGITLHPQSQAITTGQSAQLIVAAGGTSPIYQWYRGSSGDTSQPIPGATASTYSTGPLISTASYWVRVFNGCGSVNSNTATVTVAPVCAPPGVTAQPLDKHVSTGRSAQLSVTASGTDLSYQWYRGISGDTSRPVAGATAGTLMTGTLVATISFWVRVTNACGSIDSRTVTVNVWMSENNVTVGGYLGIGTDQPQRGLHIKGSNAVLRLDRTKDTSAALFVRIDDWGNVLKTFGMGIDSWGPGQGQFAIYDFGGGVGGASQRRMTIDNDGSTFFGGSLTASQFFQTSARRFKQNIRPLEDPLLKIGRLQGVQFDWKANGRRSLGFVAEEVGRVLPEAVSRDSQSGRIFGLDYPSLIALQLEAFRSQGEQLRTLRVKREDLSRLLEELKKANQANFANSPGF